VRACCSIVEEAVAGLGSGDRGTSSVARERRDSAQRLTVGDLRPVGVVFEDGLGVAAHLCVQVLGDLPA
jgi:hypothetical protein